MKSHFFEFILLLAILFAALAAEAQNKIGNGGNSVVCENKGKITSAHLLDFEEASLHPQSQLKDAGAILADRIEKLKVAAPKFSEALDHRLKEMKNEIDFKSGASLKDTQDSKHLFEPLEPGCKTLQTAIRRDHTIEGEKRFVIRKDVWDALTPIDQAGLKMHEIIYEHLSRLGETDSVKARKLNRYIFSNATIDAKDFWKFMKDLEVPIYP